MIRQAGRDWRVILLLVGGGGSGLLAVGAAISLAVFAAWDAWSGQRTTSSTAQVGIVVAVGALALIGGMLAIAGYQALMEVKGRPRQQIINTPIRFHTALVLLLVWLAASILAQAVLNAGDAKWLASPLHILAIGSPVYLVVRLGTGGLVGETKLRMWGTLAAGLVCGTGVSAVAEAALLLAGVLAAALFFVQHPYHLAAIEGLMRDLSRGSGIQDALAALQPILMHPLALAAVLMAVAVVTPLVEELAKSTAPWLIYRRLRTAAEGFCCGAVSGASFALFEGLMASADASGNWTVIFLIRAWSSMMHILASGLAGWGIAAFRLTGRSSRLIAGYGLAIGIHALWNAAVVGIGYGGVRTLFNPAEPDVIAAAAVLAGASILVSLAVSLPTAILLINRKLRAASGSLVVRQAAGDGLSLSSTGLEG